MPLAIVMFHIHKRYNIGSHFIDNQRNFIIWSFIIWSFIIWSFIIWSFIIWLLTTIRAITLINVFQLYRYIQTSL